MFRFFAGAWLSIPMALLVLNVESMGLLWPLLFLLAMPWTLVALGAESRFWTPAIFILGAHINGCILAAIFMAFERKRESKALEDDDHAATIEPPLTAAPGSPPASAAAPGSPPPQVRSGTQMGPNAWDSLSVPARTAKLRPLMPTANWDQVVAKIAASQFKDLTPVQQALVTEDLPAARPKPQPILRKAEFGELGRGIAIAAAVIATVMILAAGALLYVQYLISGKWFD